MHVNRVQCFCCLHYPPDVKCPDGDIASCWHTTQSCWSISLYRNYRHLRTIITIFQVGSGSLSLPMREHRNLAQFTVFQSLISPHSECILLEIIWIKRTFSSHSYGCFYVCIACTSKNRQLIFYGRYLPFVRCRSRGPRHERKVDLFIRSVTKPYALYTAICGITGSEIECRFQWCKRRGLLQTSLVARTHFSRKLATTKNNFKPQNALKRLKYPLKMKLNPYPFEWGMGLMDWWPVGRSQANKRPQ